MALRITQTEARIDWIQDRDAGTVRTQREYAKRWGVSIGTANGWLKSIEQDLNKTEQPLNMTEQDEPVTSILGGIRDALHEICGVLLILAKNSAVSGEEQELSSLRSESACSIERSTEQIEQTEQGSQSQPSLLSGDDAIPGPGRLANMLPGDPPTRLDGTTPKDKHEWLAENWNLIWHEVNAELSPDATDSQRNSALSALTHRYWNHRKAAAAPGKAGTIGKSFSELAEERRTDELDSWIAGGEA